MMMQGSGRPRSKIHPNRITGRIADWKGKFGWIQPDKPIAHPEAKMHKGQVYLSQMDVEAEISGIGAHVSFFVYADGTGLGAMNCRPSGTVPAVQHTVMKYDMGKAAGKGPSQKAAYAGNFSAVPPGPGQKKRVSNSMITGQVKAWKGGFGWIVPLEAVKHPLFRGQIYVKASDVVDRQPLQVGQTVSFYVYADPQGLGAEQCTILGEDGLPQKSETTATATSHVVEPKGPSGPRERLTVVPTTGEVSDWKGAFGFIRPHEAIEHEQASKRDGKVYIAKKDLVGAETLSVGQLVQFHVFVDNSGLGAEECMPF